MRTTFVPVHVKDNWVICLFLPSTFARSCKQHLGPASDYHDEPIQREWALGEFNWGQTMTDFIEWAGSRSDWIQAVVVVGFVAWLVVSIRGLTGVRDE